MRFVLVRRHHFRRVEMTLPERIVDRAFRGELPEEIARAEGVLLRDVLHVLSLDGKREQVGRKS